MYFLFNNLSIANNFIFWKNRKKYVFVFVVIVCRKFNISSDKLYNHETIVKLSKKEADILLVLIENFGEVVSVEKFKQNVWDDIETNDTAFRTVMKRLKDKITDDDFIISHKGYGYIIEKLFVK